MTDPVPLLQSLIRCPSVTPADAGALAALEAPLRAAGFACTRLPFSESGHPDIDNLYARYGKDGPHLSFSGHTDVVPPGPVSDWTHPPFAADIADGFVWGRGAVDMKGGIAAFAAAALDVIAAGKCKGSISFLITGDEEADSVNGTAKMIRWLAEHGETPDHCIVGEPTCIETLGDGVKIGRRGSIHVFLTVEGRQGHVAYPATVINPIHRMSRILDRLHSEPLDSGNRWFEPSILQCVSVDTDNTAGNVVPQRVTAWINIRYNTEHSPHSIELWLRERCDRVIADLGGSYVLDCRPKGSVFLTEPGRLSDVVSKAILETTGVTPVLNTGGGTSDARFIKDYCPVVEFGLRNRTIHQIDERVSVEELHALKACYATIIERYFEAFA
ncbi:MAG: succinyl-diaminopimelate desuccinylase [Hyphomicrobiales bacterium]